MRTRDRELKQRRRQRQGERQKSNRFGLTKQQLCACITLFCTYPSGRCTATTWNFLFSRFMWNVNLSLIFFFKLGIRPLKLNSRKIRQHLTNWTRCNNGTEVWNNANTLFWWRFVYHMLLVLAKMCECGNKLSNVRSFSLSWGKGLTSFNNNNRVTSRLNFLVKKKCKNETFWPGFFRKRGKTLN